MTPRRKTIADAAEEVLRENGYDMVVYGDCDLLDTIGRRAGMKPTHPLNRHKRILDALTRDPGRFELCYGRWSVTNRLVRGFRLKGAEGPRTW